MPALTNTFLFVEPDDNYLNFGSVVLHQIVIANKQAGQKITELMGTDANPQKIRQELSLSSPIVMTAIGHGSPSVYSVQALAPLLHAENPEELALMKDRIINLCSCLTAQILGPALIDEGAVSYTGYSKEFWFYTGDSPGASRGVQSPFLAEFQFIASLLRGKNVSEARRDQLAKYDEEIAYWTSGEGKNHADASELANILQMNKQISVFLGQGDVSASPQAAFGNMQLNPIIPFAVAAIPVFYLIYKTAF